MSDAHSPMPHPFLDWLHANQLSPSDVLAWPQIEFDQPRPGMMRIEMFHRDAQGHHFVLAMGGYAAGGSSMREVPLLVPMDDELRAMWEHCAPQVRADIARDRGLDRLAKHGATVLAVDDSNRIVFVTAAPDITEDTYQLVRGLFPGVEVNVVTGMRAVLIGDRSAAELLGAS